MTSKIKLIRTIYLYLAAAASLIFTAVGTGTLVNTGLKVVLFPEAEKKSYFECNQQPPIYGAPELKGYQSVATEDQKIQLENLLRDYQNWKENNTGEKCIKPARQNKMVDAITMIVVALPILLIHWRIIRKEKTEKE